MDVRFENGWTGEGLGVFDRRTLGWFRESNAAARHVVPSVDVIEDKDGYHFYFEMPGLTNESIDARVENSRLLIAAERKRPEWPQESEVRITERGYGSIHRAFERPSDASREGIEANYKDGVLEVTSRRSRNPNRRRF